MPALAQWANLLRVLESDGTSLRELPKLVRLSKRAVRSAAATAARSGWVEQVGREQSAARVQLTAKGFDIARRWPVLQNSAEAQWQNDIGMDAARSLRVALERVVASLPLELSHYPAGYGPADARITGGNGQDWKAVPRADGDTVSLLPLSALISQAWVAFAMAYEEHSEVALALSATVIQRLSSAGHPPSELGVSTAALSALQRHGLSSYSTT